MRSSIKTDITTVPKYIETFPAGVQKQLRQLRTLIKKLAPKAEEKISYGMPAYKLDSKPFAYFAAHKEHIGFYATPSANLAFKKELSNYVSRKGSVQFPLDKPLPVSLITKILKFKINELKTQLPHLK